MLTLTDTGLHVRMYIYTRRVGQAVPALNCLVESLYYIYLWEFLSPK